MRAGHGKIRRPKVEGAMPLQKQWIYHAGAAEPDSAAHYSSEFLITAGSGRPQAHTGLVSASATQPVNSFEAARES